MVQCYYGRRVSEMQMIFRNLDRIDLDNRVIGLRPQKTRSNWITMKIFDEVYEYLEGIKTGKYRLYSDQKYNKYLKDMAKHLEMNRLIINSRVVKGKVIEETVPLYETISSHTARTTCVTILIKQKVPYDMIMKLTGITSLNTLMIYSRIAEEETSLAIENAWKNI